MADDNLTTEPVAKPWYLSKTVLSLVAGIIMALAPKISDLTGVNLGLTEDQANMIALLVIPQLAALIGRIGATKQVTATAAKAQAINEEAAK